MASVWVHKRQHTGQTMTQVIAALRERFNKAPSPNQFKIYIESEVRIFWVYGDFSAILYMARSAIRKASSYLPFSILLLRAVQDQIFLSTVLARLQGDFLEECI